MHIWRIYLVLVVQQTVFGAVLETRKFHALQFGTTSGDFIQFTPPDMTPFRTSFTLCTWMKKLYRSPHSIEISYGPTVRTDTSDYILIGDDGYYNRGLGWFPDGAFTGKLTTPMSHWFHYCMSWSQASRTIQIFLNGEQIGSGTTGRETSISAGGDFFLGHNPTDGRDNWMFGGQLFKLNMFSVELSPTEISKIARSGLCSNKEEKVGKKRVLKWEYILNVTRSGSVTEVDTGCPSREQLLEQVVNLATLQERTREKLDGKLELVIARLADMKRGEEDELGSGY